MPAKAGIQGRLGGGASMGMIGVGRAVWRLPLPPNRTGGFPAYGSPVGGYLREGWQAAAWAVAKENSPCLAK